MNNCVHGEMVLKPGEIIRIAVSLVRKHLQSKYTQSANKLIKEHHYCIVFYDDMSPQYSIAFASVICICRSLSFTSAQ